MGKKGGGRGRKGELRGGSRRFGEKEGENREGCLGMRGIAVEHGGRGARHTSEGPSRRWTWWRRRGMVAEGVR